MGDSNSGALTALSKSPDVQSTGAAPKGPENTPYRDFDRGIPDSQEDDDDGGYADYSRATRGSNKRRSCDEPLVSRSKKAKTAAQSRAGLKRARKFQHPQVWGKNSGLLQLRNGNALRDLLLAPGSWNRLGEADRQTILAKLPNGYQLDGKPDVASLTNDNNFRDDCSQYYNSIRDGHLTENWLTKAWKAHYKDVRGDFKKHLFNAFMDNFMEDASEKPKRADKGTGNRLGIESSKKMETETSKKTDTEASKKTDAEFSNEADTETSKKTDTETSKKPDAESNKKADTESSKDADTDSSMMTDTDSSKKTDTETSKQPDAESNKKADADSSMKTDTETSKQPEAESNKKADTESSKETEAEASKKADDELAPAGDNKTQDATGKAPSPKATD
ncbi:uncharacterized protein QC763_205675 [Podospora pseudopauciseta]|uniref:ASX DEUBAD domain-containing protein n=1 Tax=Podospora pseudopauciseta TaxID=2093780 RepID=A0ABR0HPP9_9PEZI|nr:hypothetical protein QC763_205675 [Podospora pseudopauciseta]